MGLSWTFFGIPVRLNLSFLLIAAVIGYEPTRPLTSLATWIGLILVSVLWHELGHAVAFKAFGHEPEIHLMGVFGLTSSRTDKPLSNLRSLLVSAAGPFAGLLLAGACIALRVALFPTASDVLARLVIINLLLNLANLLPVVPLDGGQIMKALLDMVAPKRGGIIAHAVSLVVAAGALSYAMTHELQFTALILLGIAALNFSALRSNRRSVAGSQPAAP